MEPPTISHPEDTVHPATKIPLHKVELTNRYIRVSVAAVWAAASFAYKLTVIILGDSSLILAVILRILATHVESGAELLEWAGENMLGRAIKSSIQTIPNETQENAVDQTDAEESDAEESMAESDASVFHDERVNWMNRGYEAFGNARPNILTKRQMGRERIRALRENRRRLGLRV